MASNRNLIRLMMTIPIAFVISLSSCSKINVLDTFHSIYVLQAPDGFNGFTIVQGTFEEEGEPKVIVCLQTVSEARFSFYSDDDDESSYYLYMRERLQNLREVIENDTDFINNHYDAPFYFDVGIMSGLRVYSDAMLFGRKPGSDISDHIVLRNVNDRHKVISTFPDFSYLGKAYAGMPICEYFKAGTAVHYGYDYFCFDMIPDDMPESFQLTFEIPVDLNESWSTFPWFYKSDGYRPPTDNFVYKASTQFVDPRL